MNRRAMLTVVALGCLSHTLSAQTPPPLELSYQWSLSGKEYVTAGRTLKRDWLDTKGLTFDVVAGVEVREFAAAPSFGFGVGYEVRGLDPLAVRLGVFVLFPQRSTPDVGLGVTVGVRF